MSGLVNGDSLSHYAVAPSAHSEMLRSNLERRSTISFEQTNCTDDNTKKTMNSFSNNVVEVGLGIPGERNPSLNLHSQSIVGEGREELQVHSPDSFCDIFLCRCYCLY